MRCAAITLIGLLGVGVACAAPPSGGLQSGALLAAPAPGAAAAREPGPAGQQRLAAIAQYQRDVISVVALRAEPDYLLGAAILARPFAGQPAGLDFAALSARAMAAPNAGPAAAWARLAVCHTKADCPNAEAFAYLRQHAANNAAVWLVALDVAARDQDHQAEQAALRRAAEATIYDDYFGPALAGVAKAVAVLPPLPDTTAGAQAGQPGSPDGVRALVANRAMRDAIRPAFGPLERLCSHAAVDAHADVKTQCRKLASTLAWGSSPVARAVGLRLQGDLDPARSAASAVANHDLAWQVHQYSGLLQRALVEPTLAAAWLASARNGGTELSLILATLRANGVPLVAPAGTVPAAAGTAAD